MIEDFCYAHFNLLGRALLRVFKGIGDDLEAANMRIHPEVYLSIIGFSAVASSVVPIVYVALALLGMPTLPFLMPIAASIPFLVIASNRLSGLKNEIPYASMYLNVMATGGLSPYAGLLRLRRTTLLPKLRDEINRIQRIVLSSGMDPVSAMARAAKVVGLREYRELLLGYASTMRTGGDVLHYLHVQTESMFKRMASRIKSMGQKMGLLMEGYTIIAVLGALGLYMVFIVSLSFPAFQAFPPDVFFLFSFVLLPAVSLAFLYFADTLQISYPTSQWKVYYALASAPVCIFLLSQMVLPYYVRDLPVIPFLAEVPTHLREILDLSEGCESALGLALSLAALALPMCLSDRYYAGAETGVLEGVTNFLRDLVENRKTGLSPEKSIQMLSMRDYGKFSKHLKLMSAEISWGIPLKRVFEDFKSRVKNWLSLINLYLLIDTIEVGGGSEESLETLSEFAESTRELESERRSLLTPLFIVPYMGAAILTVTTIMLLQLFTNMSVVGGTLIQTNQLTKTLITPLVLHSFTLGLVTGKIVSGRVSAGFKHSVLLMAISIMGIWVAGHVLGM